MKSSAGFNTTSASFTTEQASQIKDEKKLISWSKIKQSTPINQASKQEEVIPKAKII
jgi:hypothetical protein